MRLYYITDRMQLGDDETIRRRHLLQKIGEAASAGVDFIQMRERDLTTRQLERLALDAVTLVHETKSPTKLLINSRLDVALAAKADGVHLRSSDISASEARAIWTKSAKSTDAIIAVSCHSLTEVRSAEAHGGDLVVFGPVFGKAGSAEPPVGINALAQAVARGGPVDHKVEAGQSLHMPVFALGGVTGENATACIQAGAAGVAGIRLFQEGDIATTVARLRVLG